MAAYRTQLPLRDYIFDMFKSYAAASIIHSSGCTVNDIFDRKFDGAVGMFCIHVPFFMLTVTIIVARTKNRPLATGRMSVLAATMCLMVQYLIAIVLFYSAVQGPSYVPVHTLTRAC